MYPGRWHETFGDKTGRSARRILPDLVRTFAVESLVEVGCGQAHWTRAALDAGVRDIRAVDGAWTDPRSLLVDPSAFRVADLAQPLDLGRRYDLALCLEVAEHVAPDAADTVVDSLVGAADVVLFGAAAKNQGGFRHINEQRPSYWRDKFAARGYEAFDLVRPRAWDDPTIHYWYRQNAFVYVRRANPEAMERAREAERATGDSKLIFDAIHPELYERIASYEDLALGRLLRRLPGWLARRVGERVRGKDA